MQQMLLLFICNNIDIPAVSQISVLSIKKLSGREERQAVSISPDILQQQSRNTMICVTKAGIVIQHCRLLTYIEQGCCNVTPHTRLQTKPSSIQINIIQFSNKSYFLWQGSNKCLRFLLHVIFGMHVRNAGCVKNCVFMVCNIKPHC